MDVIRTEPARGGTAGWAYDAFLSYSHAADSRLAPTLQRGLQRLTRAWYQRPALRAFRDQVSLAANPDLWGTIERALRESHYFVLLASPEAARSEWVGREVGFWQQHRERQTFLIVLTDGTIRWDGRAGDFDWNSTDALPGRLRGWFSREPLWVDLSWTRTLPAGQLSLRHARFRDNVGTLAAAIHERRKDQIDSEDARQHRRAALLGRAVVVVLTALLVVSGIATHNELLQRHLAEQQRAVAEQQRNLATGRELEGEAASLAAAQPRTSLQLSLAALRIDPTPQVRATMVSTLLGTRYDGSSPPEAPAFSSNSIAAFSPDGRLLATDTSQSDDVLLWNTADPLHPVRIAALTGHTKIITGIAFSPDGQLLATASQDSTVILWNVTRAPRRIAMLKVPDAKAVAFSPDGQTLAAVGGNSRNGTLGLWDITSPAAPARLAKRTGVYFPDAVAFSPDGRLLVTASGTVTGTNNGTLTGRTRTTLWDIARLRYPRPIANVPVWDGDGGFAFSPDGRTLALSFGNDAALFDIANPARPRQLMTLVGHTDDLIAMAFSPDGRTLATVGLDQNAILWHTADPAHATESAVLAGDTQPIDAVAFAAGGRTLVTADWNTEVTRWRVGGARPFLAATMTGRAGQVDALAVSPDGRTVATADYDQSVILWDVTDPGRPTVLARIRADAGPVSSVAFSPDGSVLAAGSQDDQMTLWNMRDRSRPRELAVVRCRGVVGWMAFDPRGKILVTGGDPLAQGFPDPFGSGSATLWNISDPAHPTALAQFRNVENDQHGAFTPDGNVLVLPGSLWNVSDPAHARPLPEPGHALALSLETSFGDDTAFSPDGRYAATVSYGASSGAVLWSSGKPVSARPLTELTGPTQAISNIAFHPGGNLVAAASQDFTTTLWDVADPAQPFGVLTLTGDTDAVTDLAFSPNGRLLVTGSDDGTARVWDLGDLPAIAADPVGLACQITGGGLARSQWARNAPGVPYQRSCP